RWRAPSRERKSAREETRDHAARACGSRALDRRQRARRGGGIMSLPREITEHWKSSVVLKRDLFSTIERGRFATPAGEIEAVPRRVDEVPWWALRFARHPFAPARRALPIARALGGAPPVP